MDEEEEEEEEESVERPIPRVPLIQMARFYQKKLAI